MKKEYNLKKLKKVKRGAVVNKGTKVSKTIRLDIDIVLWLTTEAENRGIKYQTLLNSLLREAMLNGGKVLTKAEVREIVKQELRKQKAS